MPHTLHTEEGIIRHLCSDDTRMVERATQHLLEQYKGLVVRLVRDANGDLKRDVPAVLHDATAVLVAHVQEGRYRAELSKLRTYFKAIARNTLLNRLRQRRAWREVPEPENMPEQPAGIEDTDKLVQSGEVREKMLNAIQQLDPACRKVLIRFWLKDQSMQEISVALDSTVDAVKQRNHRCMKKLRELLTPYFKDWFYDK